MNTEHILGIAKKIIPNLVPVNNTAYREIYKGTLNIQDKVAGVYYFDLSNQAHENFEDFQESLLSDSFYEGSSSMQWNYYLFLLNDKLNEQQIAEIEKDDRYARKFVLDEKEFVDFFDYEEAKKGVQPNVVATWKDLLDEVGLQEVYTDKDYTKIFNDFASNTSKANTEVKLKKSTSGADVIDFIDHLSLKDNYRKQPATVRDFKFRQVNLFKGINGVGKTSVFEAIELMLCGLSLRNPKVVNPNGCIEARFNGLASTQKFQSGNTSLYQARDMSWYASPSKQNTLYSSFNRFNYFNADAAHSFASSNSEAAIQPALINIVMGPEFTYIQERCLKTLDKIRPERNRLEQLLVTSNQEIRKNEQIIARYTEPEQLKFLKQTVAQNIKDLRFVTKDLDLKDNLAKAEELNNQLKVLLNNFVRTDFTYNSILDFEKSFTVFEVKKLAVEVMIGQMKELNQQLAEQVKLAKSLEQGQDLLQRALSYLRDERLLELDGLEKRLSDRNFALQKIEFVKSKLKNINLTNYKLDKDCAQVEHELREELGVCRKEIHLLEQAMSVTLEKFGKLQRLVKEIKLAGEEYLKAEPNALDCPMCQTNFQRHELESKIKIFIGHEASDTLAISNERLKIEEQNTKAKGIEVKVKELESLKNAFTGYFGQDQTMGKVSEIVSALEQVITGISVVEAEIKTLNDIFDMGEMFDLSEKDLKDIKFKVQQTFSEKLEMNITARDRFLSELEQLKGKLEKCELESQRLKDLRTAKGMEIKQLLDIPAEVQLMAAEATKALSEEENNLALFADYFHTLAGIVEIEKDNLISELQSKSAILTENLNSQKLAIQGEIELKRAQDLLAENQKVVKENTAQFARFDKAYLRLKELTSKDQNEQMDAFFDQNFAEIIDIFKAIHVPREFADLRYSSGKIILVDFDGGERGVSQISTGQRSALALSIFLSMNKKLQNGPNIIMFDDPVAFIDDLNALSFLDYLRTNVLKSGRQIFFATANMRLAHLFDKKFCFLEDGYEKWELSR